MRFTGSRFMSVRKPIWGLMLVLAMVLLAACQGAAPAGTQTAPAEEMPTAQIPVTGATSEVNPPAASPTQAGPAAGAGDSSDMGDAVVVDVGEDADLGQFLVDSEGMTLYMFTNDPPNESVCSGDCLEAWPPLITSGTVEPGDGVTAQLDTIEREDGTLQVTANSMPLYYYAPDTQPGDVTGQGVGDRWYVVAPDGTIIQ